MGSNETLTAMVIVKNPNERSWDGIGEHEFRVMPRGGERIVFDDPAGIGHYYEVVAVHHPLEPDRKVACDLYVVRVGTVTEVNVRLYEESPVVR